MSHGRFPARESVDSIGFGLGPSEGALDRGHFKINPSRNENK